MLSRRKGTFLLHEDGIASDKISRVHHVDVVSPSYPNFTPDFFSALMRSWHLTLFAVSSLLSPDLIYTGSCLSIFFSPIF